MLWFAQQRACMRPGCALMLMPDSRAFRLTPRADQP